MASPTATGRVLAGRYRLLERLGSGGMAVVHLAEDERLGRRVAVKRLHAGSPDDTAARFAREARLGASLNHPNLVTVYDTVADDGGVVIVMEYVEGETLAKAIRRDGRLAPARSLHVLRGIAAALDHAHAGGIVHRDIKPANVLLGADGAVKLVDLGIATALEGTSITVTGSVMGTAAYMAPEQLDGRDAGTRADVYALAAVAYELLAGRPAYRGATPVEIAHQVVNGPPPDLRDAWPEAPAAVVDVLRRGTAFEPGERPATAGAFVDELARALEPREQGLLPRLPRLPPTAPPPRRGRLPRTARVPRTARAPRALLLAAAALLAVGAVAAAILLGGGSGGDDRSGASARQERAQRAERRRERQRAAQQQQQGGAYAVPQPGGSSAQEGARLQAEGHRLLESGAATAAVPVLERSVRAFPAGTDALDLQYALFDLGKALRLAGRPADAIPVLELRRRHPNQPDVVQRELDLARAAAGQ